MRWIPPTWLHALGQLSRRSAARRFEQAAADPAGAQRAILQEMLTRNAQTAYGREHGFADLADPDAFRARVPVVTLDELQPWLQRMKQGERGLLTAEDPVHWVRTSGSTGVPKDVPVTPSYIRAYQAPLMAFLWHLYRKHPEGFRGRGGYAVSHLRFEDLPDGLPVGSMSGLNYQRMPAVVRALYAWPPELLQVTDGRTWRFLALLLTSLDEISLAATIFPVTLVQLLRGLHPEAEALAHAARTGALPDDLVLDPPLRAFFAARLRPRPDVADRLRAAAGAPEDEAVATAWPHLRLVLCWTGATAALYLPELKRRLGPQVVVHDAVYSASEGWLNVPLYGEEPGGPVAVHGHFLEFVPLGAYQQGSRDSVLAHELVEGERYVLLITNQAGLYRYDLRDVVECCGRHLATPAIRFVQKVGRSSNLCGELLDEPQVSLALAAALDELGAQATWCTLVAVAEDPLGYDLWVEPRGALPPELAPALDRHLCRLNPSHYAPRRDLGLLRPLRLRLVPPGTWAQVEQDRRDAGLDVAQVKAAHLALSEADLPARIREAGS